MIVAVTGGRDVLPTAPELDVLLLGLDALHCTTLRHGHAVRNRRGNGPACFSKLSGDVYSRK